MNELLLLIGSVITVIAGLLAFLLLGKFRKKENDVKDNNEDNSSSVYEKKDKDIRINEEIYLAKKTNSAKNKSQKKKVSKIVLI